MSDSEIESWEQAALLDDDADDGVDEKNRGKETTDLPPAARRTTTTSNKKTATTDRAEGEYDVKAIVIPKYLQQPFDDPEKERERQKLINEFRDVALAGAAFGLNPDEEDDEMAERSKALLQEAQTLTAIKPVADDTLISAGTHIYDRISLERLKDVEQFCEGIAPRIDQSQAKSIAWYTLLERLLTMCAPKMTPNDIANLQKKVETIAAGRKREKNLQRIKAKKANDLKVNVKNYQAELDMMEGDDSEDNSSLAEDDEFADFC